MADFEFKRNRTVESILGAESDAPAKEHQPNAEPNGLTVRRNDGRRNETFAWSMYGGHDWDDDGDMERIIALFGPRTLALRGYRFEELDKQMSRGRRTNLIQRSAREAQQLLTVPGNDPIVVEVESYPSFVNLLLTMRAEEEERAKELSNAVKSGFAKKFER